MKKRYQLTETAKPFERDGKFQFRVRYEVPADGGKILIVALQNCPIIAIPSGGIVETRNPTAQRLISSMRAPDRTVRNQSRRSGLLFKEVTAKAPYKVDIDLDQWFDGGK